MHVTVDDVNFCDGLDCVHLYVKYKSCASTARELPDFYMAFWGLIALFLCNNLIVVRWP